MGECVELAPAPGEEGPRVAVVEALWAERADGGWGRMFGRFRRYCRPQVRRGGTVLERRCKALQ